MLDASEGQFVSNFLFRFPSLYSAPSRDFPASRRPSADTILQIPPSLRLFSHGLGTTPFQVPTFFFFFFCDLLNSLLLVFRARPVFFFPVRDCSMNSSYWSFLLLLFLSVLRLLPGAGAFCPTFLFGELALSLSGVFGMWSSNLRRPTLPPLLLAAHQVRRFFRPPTPPRNSSYNS